MAIHAPIMGALLRATHIQAEFRLANRLEIEEEIERLIGLLDAIDAPLEDLEPEQDYCLAGDDGCDPMIINGRTYWGSGEEEGDFIPKFGPDQTAEPINKREAVREWHCRQLMDGAR